MQENANKGKSLLKWDLIVIAAVLAIDELRNGIFLFLGSLDGFSLIALLGVVWYLSSKKLKLGSMGKMRLFDGFLQKYDDSATTKA
ncbi:MAG: hypothetical protein V1717_02880 [Candidatus Micrarchaeota archaeon]